MKSRFGKAVLIALISFLVLSAIAAVPGWKASWGYKNPPPTRHDFNDLSGLDFYVNGKGEIGPPPFHVGKATINGGILAFSVDPDADYINRKEILRPGAPGSDLYNNMFGVERTEYAPTLYQNIETVVRMRIPQPKVGEIHGTGGFWSEDSNDFNQAGYLQDGGFGGAVGVSYTGLESDKLISGFKFIYTKGFTPLCIKTITDVDVTQWHDYKIVWSKTLFGHKYELFVDNIFKAKCNIPFVGFERSSVQFWRDNYLIGPWLKIMHQNFDQTQSIEYDWITIEAVNK